MITRAIFVRIAFWCSLAATVGRGVAIPTTEAMHTRRRIITADSGNARLPVVPRAGEQSVHTLTAVGFPPPALFYADPDKSWTIDEFERPERPTSYAVTDDATELDGPDGEEAQPVVQQDDEHSQEAPWAGQQDEPHPETTVASEVEAERATTADGKTDEGSTTTTTTTTTQSPRTVVDGRDDAVFAGQRRPSLFELLQSVDGGWFERQTIASGKPSGQAEIDRPQRRRQHQTIILTSRPLPRPAAADIDYLAVRRRRGEPAVSLRDFRRG